MPSEPSKYAENQFLTATVGRIPLMDELLAHTAPRLTAAAAITPAFDDAVDIFGPAHDAWNKGMTALANANAAVPGATYALTDKLASLTRKPSADVSSPLETWDTIIRSAVAYQGPTYMNLLPQGRDTLKVGTIDEQIDAIENFAIRLKDQTTKPTLVTLSPVVLAFATEARALRTRQEDLGANLEQARKDQEALRIRCAGVLYQVVARAMWLWVETPLLVDSLIDVGLLRGPAQVAPEPPVDTTWTPATRTLSTSELPSGATRVEAWRLAPGGAPELIGTSNPNESFAEVPETIVFQAGVNYQLWLESLNSKGNSEASPVQNWTAPVRA